MDPDMLRMTSPLLRREPWLTAVSETASCLHGPRMTLANVKEQYFLGSLPDNRVPHLLVLISYVCEKFQDAYTLVVEDETGAIDCILKFPSADGSRDYLSKIDIGVAVLLKQPFLCGLSRLKPYLVVVKEMIETIFWAEMDKQSSVGAEWFSSQFSTLSQPVNIVVSQWRRPDLEPNEQSASQEDEDAQLRHQLQQQLLTKALADVKRLQDEFASECAADCSIASSTQRGSSVNAQGLNQGPQSRNTVADDPFTLDFFDD